MLTKKQKIEIYLFRRLIFLVMSKLAELQKQPSEDNILLAWYYMCALHFLSIDSTMYTKEGFRGDNYGELMIAIYDDLNENINEEILKLIKINSKHIDVLIRNVNERPYLFFYKTAIEINHYLLSNSNLAISIDNISVDNEYDWFDSIVAQDNTLEQNNSVNYQYLVEISESLFQQLYKYNESSMDAELCRMLLEKIAFLKYVHETLNIQKINLIHYVMSSNTSHSFLQKLCTCFIEHENCFINGIVLQFLLINIEPVTLSKILKQLHSFRYDPTYDHNKFCDDHSLQVISEYVCDLCFSAKAQEQCTNSYSMFLNFIKLFMQSQVLENSTTDSIYTAVFLMELINLYYEVISAKQNAIIICKSFFDYIFWFDQNNCFVLNDNLNTENEALKSSYAEVMCFVKSSFIKIIHEIHTSSQKLIDNIADNRSIFIRSLYDKIFQKLNCYPNTIETYIYQQSLGENILLPSLYNFLNITKSIFLSCKSPWLTHCIKTITVMQNFESIINVRYSKNVLALVQCLKDLVTYNLYIELKSLSIEDDFIRFFCEDLSFYSQENMIQIQQLSSTENFINQQNELINLIVKFLFFDNCSQDYKLKVINLLKILLMPYLYEAIYNAKQNVFMIHPHNANFRLSYDEECMVSYISLYCENIINSMYKKLQTLQNNTKKCVYLMCELCAYLSLYQQWLTTKKDPYCLYFLILLQYIADIFNFLIDNNKSYDDWVFRCFCSMTDSVIMTYNFLLNNGKGDVNELLNQIHNVKEMVISEGNVINNSYFTKCSESYILKDISKFNFALNLSNLNNKNNSYDDPESIENEQRIKGLKNLRMLIFDMFNQIWQELLMQYWSLDLYTSLMYQVVTNKVEKMFAEEANGSFVLHVNDTCAERCDSIYESEKFFSIVYASFTNVKLAVMQEYQTHVVRTFWDMFCMFFTNFFTWLSLKLNHCQQGEPKLISLFDQKERELTELFLANSSTQLTPS